MLYARSDVQAHNPHSQDCPGHTEPADTETVHPLTKQVHFSISCTVCELELADDPLWSARLKDVPLTKDEQDHLDEEKQETENAMAQFSRALISQLMSTSSPAAPALAPAPVAAVAPAPAAPVEPTSPARAKPAARTRKTPAKQA